MLSAMRANAILVALALAGVASAQSYDPSLFGGLGYRLVGPFRAGRALACCGVPGQVDTYYFGAVGGGVWKSENSGRTWTPVFDQTGVASIGAIAVDPSDPQTVYVGTGEADMRSDIQQGEGMFKSTDGGQSWARIGLPGTRQIGKILVDPKDANVVWVAALGHPYGPNIDRGVFKSTDGGKTWAKVLFIDKDTGAIDLAMDPSDPKTVLAAMWQTRRPPWSIYPPSSGPGSGLYKTTDGGSTWKQMVGKGLPKAIGRIGLSFCESKPDRVYAVIDTNGNPGGGIYVSNDKGVEWEQTSKDERLWGRGWYFGGITADTKDADTVYVMNTGMYRSTDAGKTFVPIKGAPGGDDYHTLWINPDDPMRMIVASDQGTVVSVDGAKTWSSWWNQPTGQFYHVIADNRFPYWVYGSQQDSGAMAVASRSNHDILTWREWRPLSAGGESGTLAADRLHPGTMIDDSGTIERMEDGWHKTVDPTHGKEGGPWRKTWTLPIVASPIDPKVFYTSHQRVFRSGDSGESWQLISPDLTQEKNTVPPNLDEVAAADQDKSPRKGVVYWLGASPVKLGVLWAGTDDGLIWKTMDDGAHWINVTPGLLKPWNKVGIIDAGHFSVDTAYAAVDRHRLDDNAPYIFRTHDGGKSWQVAVHGLPPDEWVNVVREDPVRKGLLWAGTERGVYVSFDDGDDWLPLKLNLPPASVRDIVFAGNDVVVGTHGRAIWILDDASMLRQVTSGAVTTTLYKPADAVAFVRGPGFDDGTPLPIEEPRCENPPSGAILDYSLATAAKLVTLTVKDAKGKEVASFSSEDKPREPDVTKLTIAPYWVKPKTGLSTQAGGHRFVWEFGQNQAPGTYTVTLTVDGKPFSQPVRVVADPRPVPKT